MVIGIQSEPVGLILTKFADSCVHVSIFCGLYANKLSKVRNEHGRGGEIRRKKEKTKTKLMVIQWLCPGCWPSYTTRLVDPVSGLPFARDRFLPETWYVL